MTNIKAILLGTAVTLVLAVGVRAQGQIAAQKSAGESAAGEKKVEPDWTAIHQFGNSFYLNNLVRVRQAHEQFRKDPEWRDFLMQSLGWEYSNVGRYRQSLDCFNSPNGRQAKLGQLVSAEQFESRDAAAAIVELADKHQVVMINEAHHVPPHRAFTLQLLEELYRKGFRYFAAETLSIQDKELQTRGYPTLRTGTYIAEPVYADLVRTALKLGYQVVPYEFQAGLTPSQLGDRVAMINARDQGQAKNLKSRILDKDPAAKIIVHAGYSHICKTVQHEDKGDVRWMALAFQELTGIEPLCVDQTQMSECNKPANETADYRFAVEHGLVKDQPVVLRDKETGGYFAGSPGGISGDLCVVHPRSRYVDGRPTWLALGGRRKPHGAKTELRPPQGAFYLAQAFYPKELGSEAVPIDQMAYTANDPVPTLWLPPGEVHVRIVDENGKVLQEYATSER